MVKTVKKMTKALPKDEIFKFKNTNPL